jgi:hypothetical protein
MLSNLGAHLGFVGGTDEGTNVIWPAANRALYMPFSLQEARVVKQGFVVVAVPSGNIDMGIFAIDGTRLVSSGSVAVAGTNTIQVIDFADTLLNPGYYYHAISVNNTVAAFYRAVAASVAMLQALGLQQEASAFPLPATATPVNPATDYVPRSGLTFSGVI